jgi:hypothetical protein
MPKLPTCQAILDPVYMIDDYRQIGRGAGCRLCLFFSRMGILDGSFDWEEQGRHQMKVVEGL